jgi:error-prone DNA polymerase
MVLDVDVNSSAWDCSLEAVAKSHEGRALRLGFREIKSFPEVVAVRIVAARGSGYRTLADLHRHADISKAVLARLARADAFRSMGLSRRKAAWEIRALNDVPLPLFAALVDGREEGEHKAKFEPGVDLPKINMGEHVVEDYAMLRLSLRCHPVQLLRPELTSHGVVRVEQLVNLKPERRVSVAGLVLVRQRPGTAKGVIFATLEDESGSANVIIWSDVFERFRNAVMAARLLVCTGRLQREGLVIHIIAQQLKDLSHRLDGLVDLDRADEAPAPPAKLPVISHDFH